MLRLVKRVVDGLLDWTLSPDAQFRLGMHIANRARGDDDYDPNSNGEYWALGRIKRSLSGAAVLIDAGAHVGEWTLQAVDGLPEGSDIYSVEPSAATFARLKETVERRRSSARIHPVQAALSDQDGEGILHVDGELHGTNSLHEHSLADYSGDGPSRAAKQETVSLLRGDAFCALRGIKRVHLLKIDTEGHEVEVLRGFEEMLSRKAIDYVQFEYFHGWIDAGHFLREAVTPLIDKGYIVGKLARERLIFMDGYDKTYEKFGFSNFLAIRDAGMAASWRS